MTLVPTVCKRFLALMVIAATPLTTAQSRLADDTAHWRRLAEAQQAAERAADVLAESQQRIDSLTVAAKTAADKASDAKSATARLTAEQEAAERAAAKLPAGDAKEEAARELACKAAEVRSAADKAAYLQATAKRAADALEAAGEQHARESARLNQALAGLAVQSQRPLEEKLTLFWHGHFATEFRTVWRSYALYEQNELFRRRAADNFGALLHGIIHDPAMLRYLDNDVMEAARALTGYAFDPATGQFRFSAQKHDMGTKTSFGSSGDWFGEDLVELILKQPATARFTAGKMFRFFAHENPDPATVDALASLLRARDYDLAPMLTSLFRSEEFYRTETMGSHIKGPVVLVVGLFRELGIRDVDTSALDAAAQAMGQELFAPPNVRGWQGGRQWINANAVTARYNALADLIPPQPSQRREHNTARSISWPYCL
jgi:uncharacterized protein (DUF1800 family)